MKILTKEEEDAHYRYVTYRRPNQVELRSTTEKRSKGARWECLRALHSELWVYTGLLRGIQPSDN